MKAICKVEKGYAWPTSPDPLSLDEWGGMIKWRIKSILCDIKNDSKCSDTVSLISYLLCFICLPVSASKLLLHWKTNISWSKQKTLHLVHRNRTYFVKCQIMLTWGQIALKCLLAFVSFTWKKIYYCGCYHPFLYQYFIYASACALFHSSSRSNFAFELVIFGVVRVQGMEKLPRSFLQDSV